MSITFEHPKGRRRITDLDDNLVIEILSQLPYKFVMMNKSVCKLWNSLISTPYFARRFLRHRLQNINNLEVENEQPWTFMYAPSNLDSVSRNIPRLTSRHSVFGSPGFSLNFVPCFQPQQEAICVVRTFNDLILCCGYKNPQSKYYICNPITMQYVALPPAPPISSRLSKLCVDFICEPYYQKHHRNEGIDVVLNTQYRFWVVRVEKFVTFLTKNDLRVQIFSSETGKWDEYPVSIPEAFANLGVRSHRVESLALCKNNILITTTELNGFEVRPWMIKVSNLNNNLNFKDEHCPLVKFALLSKWGFDRTPDIKIWELDDKDFEWRLADRVCLSSYIDVSENFRQSFENDFVWATYKDVLGMDPHNQNVVYLSMDTDDGGMFKFDIQSRTLFLLRNHRIKRFNDHRMEFFQIVVRFWPTPMPQISST